MRKAGRSPSACPGPAGLPFRFTARPRRYLVPVEQGQITAEHTVIEETEELWQEEDTDHDGWFCVRTDPFPCPASGSTFVAEFMTAAHLILVWQELDDPNLLRHAARARDVGRNPRVTGYRSAYGPSASYYAWIAAGRPVHGVKQA